MDWVARAQTVWEHLAWADRDSPLSAHAYEHPRFARWHMLLAAPDDARFALRAHAVGSTPTDLCRACSAEAIGAPLDDWANPLRALIADAFRTEVAGAPACDLLRGEVVLPFQDLLNPLVQAAMRRAWSRVRLDTHGPTELERWVSHSVLGDWGQILLARLCHVCSLTLFQEFDAMRPVGERLLGRLVPGLHPAGASATYLEFVAAIRGNQFQKVFSRYPMLGRLVWSLIDTWCANVVAWYGRLVRDRDAIVRAFVVPGDAEPGRVTRITGPLSDPHNGGQTVVGVWFDSGLRLAYKPRDLAMDVAFTNLVRWCNARGLTLDLRTCRVLPRRGYGWAEWVAPQACRDRDEARAYFRRAGELLGLLYVLGGTDFHNENIIAAGPYPVPVDLETLCNPGVGLADPASRDLDPFSDSVVRVGMLPQWDWWSGGTAAVDLSALGGTHAQPTALPVMDWLHVNSDAMTLEFRVRSLPQRHNAATLDGEILRVGDFADEVAAGCSEMLHLILGARDELLAGDGPLASFRGLVTRVLVRHTQQYSTVLRHALQPQHLADGRDFCIELDALARGALSLESTLATAACRLVTEEHAALLRLDIPYVVARTDQCTLFTLNGEVLVPHWWNWSGFQRVRDRIARLRARTIDWQCQVIQRSVALHGSSQSLVHPAGHHAVPVPEDRDRHAAHFHVRVLVERLARSAVRQGDGSISWLAATPLGPTGRCRLRSGDFGFYSGSTGIALALAAYDHVYGAWRYRTLARRCLLPITSMMRLQNAKAALSAYAREVGMGLATGIGGVLLGWSHLAQWWRDDQLCADAVQLAASAVVERPQSWTEADVISGVAGFIIGAGSVLQVTQSPQIRQAMVHAATQLAQMVNTRCPTGAKEPQQQTDTLLMGFSHGASGIAFALGIVHAIHPDGAFAQAIERLLAYEDQGLDHGAGTWVDLRHDAGDAHGGACSWCHGAPGIALARSRLTRLGFTMASTGLSQAIATTCANVQRYSDHLCCGTLGVLEILAHIATVHGDSALAGVARQGLLHRLGLGMPWRVFPVDVPDFGNPGFMDGYAGIAYALMQLAQPDRLPNILAFDSI